MKNTGISLACLLALTWITSCSHPSSRMEEAIRNYRKALVIDPFFASSAKVLDSLGIR